MPRRVTPVPSSSEIACCRASGSVALTNCPGLRRNTAQSVYSVSPETGVVTAVGNALSAGAGLSAGLWVMGSIILWWAIGICEFAECPDFAERACCLAPGLFDHGGESDPGGRLADGGDSVGHRRSLRCCDPVNTGEADEGACRDVHAEQEGGIRPGLPLQVGRCPAGVVRQPQHVTVCGQFIREPTPFGGRMGEGLGLHCGACLDQEPG